MTARSSNATSTTPTARGNCNHKFYRLTQIEMFNTCPRGRGHGTRQIERLKELQENNMIHHKKDRGLLVKDCVWWSLTGCLLGVLWAGACFAALNAMRAVKYFFLPGIRLTAFAEDVEYCLRCWLAHVLVTIVIIFICMAGLISRRYNRVVSKTTVIALALVFVFISLCLIFASAACSFLPMEVRCIK